MFVRVPDVSVPRNNLEKRVPVRFSLSPSKLRGTAGLVDVLDGCRK